MSENDKQKLSKILSKRFQRSGYCNEYKTKEENKNTTNEYRSFLESNFLGFNRLFLLTYSSKDDSSKRYKTRKYYLPKGVIKNNNVIISRKNFFDQPSDSAIKRYKEIRK